MELGGIIGVPAIIVAIFLSTVAFVWQSNSQAGRFDSRMNSSEEKIEIMGRRVSTGSTVC